jgi:hypothetical protein
MKNNIKKSHIKRGGRHHEGGHSQQNHQGVFIDYASSLPGLDLGINSKKGIEI